MVVDTLMRPRIFLRMMTMMHGCKRTMVDKDLAGVLVEAGIPEHTAAFADGVPYMCRTVI